MAEKVWTTKEDWQEWAWTDGDLDYEDGSVTVAEGSTLAVGLSPVVCATPWSPGDWGVFSVKGTRPSGCRYKFRFRVGATVGGLGDWSEYIDAPDSEGTIIMDIGTYADNNPTFDVGPYIQVELTLKTS